MEEFDTVGLAEGRRIGEADGEVEVMGEVKA